MVTKIISGFPGVGKTNSHRNLINFETLDSDSSKFIWISEGVRNPDFPNNYIQHIKDNIGKFDIIFVSSHDVVRKALEENDIKYYLVYPNIDLKKEYIERYRSRGDTESFINMIDSNWDKFINDIKAETYPKLIELYSGEGVYSIITGKFMCSVI